MSTKASFAGYLFVVSFLIGVFTAPTDAFAEFDYSPDFYDYSPSYYDYSPSYYDYSPDYYDYSPSYYDYSPDYYDYSPDYYDYSPDFYDYSYDYYDYSYDYYGYDYDVYAYDYYDYGYYDTYWYGYDYYSSPTYYGSTGYSSYPIAHSVPIAKPSKGYTSQPITVSTGKPSAATPQRSNVSYVDNSVSYVDNSINDSFNTTTIMNSFNTGTGYAAPVHKPTHATPSCSIYVTGSFGYGQTLTWHTYNATSASISGVGAVTTGYGTRVVYPTHGQIFTMTVSGAGGTSTCQTSSYQYAAPITPTYPISQVALSQIPYTGFDLGPIGNTLFWVGLALFSIAGSYFLVYYRGGIMRFLRTEHSEIELAPAFVPATIAVEELDDEAIKLSARDRVTRDAMGIDLSSGVPRIVVARG